MQPYAIVKTGGQQYTVRTGDVLKVDLFEGKAAGDEIELVTLVARGEGDLQVGSPELDGKVKATILEEEKAKKILVFKNRRRNTYRKKNGHRQRLHRIRIESIPV